MQFLNNLFVAVVVIAIVTLRTGEDSGFGVQASKVKPLLCTLPHSADGYVQPTVWRCHGQLPLWSYNRQSNECVEFRYGGCGGNDNSFFTREHCEATCRG